MTSNLDPGQVARAAREIGEIIHASPDGSLPPGAIESLLDRYPLELLHAAVARVEGADIKLTDQWMPAATGKEAGKDVPKAPGGAVVVDEARLADTIREAVEAYLTEVDPDELDADDLAWTLVRWIKNGPRP
ncbi:hypothetical protein [Streptomyces sp. HUAS TT7]|uniref:hypothetical protein n=1 Tax=Streptomyces sp. HUAS TT7 TaxID=3447507 RepID=UPI003F658ECF